MDQQSSSLGVDEFNMPFTHKSLIASPSRVNVIFVRLGSFALKNYLSPMLSRNAALRNCLTIENPIRITNKYSTEKRRG